jgi:UTP--glucose-1-phosphate uridylyltransferase
MADVYLEHGASVLGVEVVPPAETDKYGIVATEAPVGRLSQIKQIVEKPKPAQAPSNLAVVGRYLLTPKIFEKLEKTGRGAGGEIQLTDAIADLLAEERVMAYQFDGKRYDCGSKLGYLQATVEYGLKHDTLGVAFSEYLIGLAKELQR